MYNNDERKYREQGYAGYDYAAPERERTSAQAADDFEKMLYSRDEASAASASTEAYRAPREDYVYEESTAREESRRDAYAYPEEEARTPGPTTMQFADESLHENPYEDFHTERSEGEDARYRINTKSKVFIAVYAIVVAAIFALIVLNTRLLKSMNATISSQQSQIASLKEQSEVLKDELEFVSGEEEIERRAAEMGYVRS